MDKYVRIGKPILKPGLHDKTTTKPPVGPGAPGRRKLKEWADVVSEEAADFDVAALSKEEMEDVLRLFDLNPAYGPFVGVDREFRWERANKCGLNPPLLIKRIIESGKAVQQREGGHLW